MTKTSGESVPSGPAEKRGSVLPQGHLPGFVETAKSGRVMQTERDYNQHWDDKFSSREWGRYPPEDLVRFVGRNFKVADRSEITVLEVGCGPGANVWFLHREGYRVAGIDGSPAAIDKARIRIEAENEQLNRLNPDLRVGNFSSLPWAEQSFDLVIDIFSIYANTIDVI